MEPPHVSENTMKEPIVDGMDIMHQPLSLDRKSNDYDAPYIVFGHYTITVYAESNISRMIESKHICVYSTSIRNSFHVFLSRIKTKTRLTEYLSTKLFAWFNHSPKRLDVSTENGAKFNRKGVDDLTMHILVARYAALIHILCSDTGVPGLWDVYLSWNRKQNMASTISTHIIWSFGWRH